MKIIKVIVVLLCVFFIISANQAFRSGKVVKVRDGDTVEVEDSNKNRTVLRLAEVDCPEIRQPFGVSARNFTVKQVYLKSVKYIVIGKDHYGRSIAKVYHKGKYLSAEIIRKGMGWQYKKYSNSYKLKILEYKARINKLGLWMNSDPAYPPEWRQEN
jgi:micrococcal nuclease|tara:strand:+ start:3189 stop:3659 length:471 start_codon:yes stop_codon:yes gene_type:complete